ncbi:SIS domain-containing protein, partial [Coprobacillus cateniformis]
PAKLLSHELYVEKQWIDCIDDNVRMNLLHHIADENSLFIIFSVIAKHKDMLEAIKKWKNRNSKVVLITSNPDTPFLPYVDISFILPSTTPIPIENTHSFHYLNNIPIYSAFVEFIIYIYIQTQ